MQAGLASKGGPHLVEVKVGDMGAGGEAVEDRVEARGERERSRWGLRRGRWLRPVLMHPGAQEAAGWR